jgi:flavin reductase (DIM6/NTAB) family NADH-FMN oxidoreductase RutF
LIDTKQTQAERGVDLRELRHALGQFATGVTVVTARGDDGRPVGVTANSFSSLSLEPPLVLWCLASDAASLPVYRECTHFGVNVLSASQHHLSRFVCDRGPDGGEAQVRDRHSACAPRVRIAHSCSPQRPPHRSGDHAIVIGEVEHHVTIRRRAARLHSGPAHPRPSPELDQL